MNRIVEAHSGAEKTSSGRAAALPEKNRRPTESTKRRIYCVDPQSDTNC